MARIELLNTDAHRDIRILARADARLGDDRHFERIVVSEFAEAAVHYPIFLATDSDTGAFFAGAMMGFKPGENLFLGRNGQSSYRPLGIRREPFFISADNLALDLDHPRVSRSEGEPLFDQAGEPLPFLKGIQRTLTQLMAGIDATKAFIDAMLALDLVEPIDISLSFDDGERCRLDGLYTISNDTLNELADDEVLRLFRKGYLQLAYSMAGSLRQVPVLAQARNARLLDPV